MADTDTAVLDAVATADSPPTPPAVTETEAVLEPTETQEVIEEPTDSETEPEVFTKEDLDRELKAQEARLKESARQREENARKEAQTQAQTEAYRRRLTEAEQTLTTGAYRSLVGGVKQIQRDIENGETVSDENVTRWLGGLAKSLGDAAFVNQDAAYAEAFNWYLAEQFPDYKPERELARFLEVAVANRQMADIVTARNALMEAAITSKLTPKLREAVEAELAEANGAAKKVADLKGADETRKGSTARPTGVAGSPGRGVDGSVVIHNTNTSLADKRAAFKRKYGYDPD